MKKIKKIPLKYLILVVTLIVCLIGAGIYTTYSYYSYNYSVNNVVKINTVNEISKVVTLDEGHVVGVLPGERVSIELNITNSTSKTLNYACWYELIDGSLDSVRATQNAATSGTISASETINRMVYIYNDGSSVVVLNVGASGTEDNNLSLPSTKNLITTIE